MGPRRWLLVACVITLAGGGLVLPFPEAEYVTCVGEPDYSNWPGPSAPATASNLNNLLFFGLNTAPPKILIIDSTQADAPPRVASVQTEDGTTANITGCAVGFRASVNTVFLYPIFLTTASGHVIVYDALQGVAASQQLGFGPLYVAGPITSTATLSRFVVYTRPSQSPSALAVVTTAPGAIKPTPAAGGTLTLTHRAVAVITDATTNIYMVSDESPSGIYQYTASGSTISTTTVTAALPTGGPLAAALCMSTARPGAIFVVANSVPTGTASSVFNVLFPDDDKKAPVVTGPLVLDQYEMNAVLIHRDMESTAAPYGYFIGLATLPASAVVKFTANATDFPTRVGAMLLPNHPLSALGQTNVNITAAFNGASGVGLYQFETTDTFNDTVPMPPSPPPMPPVEDASRATLIAIIVISVFIVVLCAAGIGISVVRRRQKKALSEGLTELIPPTEKFGNSNRSWNSPGQENPFTAGAAGTTRYVALEDQSPRQIQYNRSASPAPAQMYNRAPSPGPGARADREQTRQFNSYTPATVAPPPPDYNSDRGPAAFAQINGAKQPPGLAAIRSPRGVNQFQPPTPQATPAMMPVNQYGNNNGGGQDNNGVPPAYSSWTAGPTNNPSYQAPNMLGRTTAPLPAVGTPRKTVIGADGIAYSAEPVEDDVEGGVTSADFWNRGLPILPADGWQIPPVAEESIKWLNKKGLDTEGIFRIPAVDSVVKKFLQEFESGSRRTCDDMLDAHEVAALLKMWVKLQDPPVFPKALINALILASNIQDGDAEKPNCMRAVIDALPPPRRRLMALLSELFVNIAANYKVNKMKTVNIALVFSPTLFKDISMGVANNILVMWILNYKEIFC